MKKQGLSVLVILTLVFASFTLGFFLGSHQEKSHITVNVPAAMQTMPAATEPVTTPPEATEVIAFPIDINRASKEEFMALPGIGEVLADRILAYRDANGNFTAPEGLMHVEGIGEKRMEEILDLITIGGHQ